EGWLHTSPDGIHWSDPIVTTPVGDNTSFFYNPFRKKWCMSVRRWYAGLRTRFYTERDDFLNGVPWNQEQEEVLWQRIDNLALPDPARPNHRVALYDVNVTPYESLMLGLFAIFRGPENHICEAEGVPKTIDLEIGYSRDGFHFSRPDRTPFLEASRQLGDWNRAYLHAVGGVCMVVGDEVWIYFTGFSGESPKLGKTDTGSPRRDWRGMYAGASTGLATIRRDGFVSMDAGAEGGVLTTNSVIFKASRLFVNVDNPHGELKVELLVDGQPVAGLDAESCVPVSKDSTCCEVTWRSGIDLSRVANRSVQFRFHLKSGRLFSFWVTDKPNGASAGYLGAGGPGYANGRDL
ncbi:MAG: glycosyl hydrolase family 32, partial [Candidatus Latescibacteria bacterium]|nr:glycosyl hydrolase family 32 [Candidatus Latescibacterota bacterium]